MSERRCVYTVLTGGYETLLEQHVARLADTDLICFTDEPIPAGSAWEARPLDLVLPADPNRSSRRPKMLAHEYLPDYDASLFIDNNVLLTADPAVMFDRFLPPEVSMAAFAHSFRATLREEFEEVVLVGKEAAWVCDEQLAAYEATDPEALELRPIAGGFLFRRHHEPEVRAAMQRWWEHVLRYSRRDQLSLIVAARATGLEIAVHEVDNHLSEYHEWPRMAHRDPAGGAPLPHQPAQRIADLEAELTSLRHELEAQRDGEQARVDAAVRQGVDATRAELHESTSWRITAPLRRLKDIARAARGEPTGDRTE